MKVRSLFDLVSDASDLLDFFARVESEEQLVSRLERLKRQNTDDLLSSIETLRISVEAALSDTLEMTPSMGDEDDFEGDLDEEGDLKDLDLEDEPGAETSESEDQVAAPAPEDVKS